MKRKEKYFVYILRTSGNTLYTGQTNNLEKRLSEHRGKTKKSAKYMRCFKSFSLVYSEEFKNRSEAMKRETGIKRMTKVKKEKLVSGYNGQCL
jgi:putative endonuclease